jgi:predicted kinase
VGADVQTIFVDAPLEALQERLARRNLDLPAGTFKVSAEELDEWASRFEAPTQDELR